MVHRATSGHQSHFGWLATLALAAGYVLQCQTPGVAEERTPILGTPAVPQSAVLTRRLVADTRDGRLDAFDLVGAALVASGVEDECELAGWLGYYADHRAEALANAALTPGEQPFAALHAALHAKILVGRYKSGASDLRMALVHGEYNCLSSAVLYLDLCRETGQELQLWSQPGHVFVTAKAGSTRIEPSARAWNPRAAGGLARSLTPTELLAKFYYNRGIELLTKSEFSTGLSLLHISLQLDASDADARQNLLAGINNWSVECCRQRRYQEAAALIEQGLMLEPLFAPLRANERYVRQLLAE